MNRSLALMLTGLAPAIWGSTYLVTTEFLPDGYPLTAAMLRALPAGLLLLLLTRVLPKGVWLLRVAILGALNFSIFWWLLFVAAYELPGGVAATIGAIQPLIVLYLAKLLLDQQVRFAAVAAGLAGVVGVALLVLTPAAALNATGVLAAAGGAFSMAVGTVLTRKWQPPVSALTFTAWQLVAGGLLLLPAALIFEPSLPALSIENVGGFTYLGLIGGALTYVLWFRGIAVLGPAAVAPLGLLSPVSALLLGWGIADESFTVLQTIGVALVLGSIWFSQWAQSRGPIASPRQPLRAA
ncbi:MAG: EamA family transporter [Alphaproteobacteria bacterium]|nr:EamA family transporter [Alphaproteobacteria bacterium SS10]